MSNTLVRDLDRKARGAFFTPTEVSQFIVNWAVRGPDDLVLEPSCGDASFLLPAAEKLVELGTNRSDLTQQLHGVEIHSASIAEARGRLAAINAAAAIVEGDFFEHHPTKKFDAVIGNPPYVRYQQFSGAARLKSREAALAGGVRLTALASSWAAFTVHAAEMLTDDGRLGLVLPAELMSVNYAGQVRRFLMGRFAKVRLVLFEQLIFPGVLEDVVLLLAEGRGTTGSFEVYQARDAAGLSSLDTSGWRDFVPVADEKWTSALVPGDAFVSYREVTTSTKFGLLRDWGSAYLGSVTGSNDFFSLTATDAAKLGLDESEVLRISPPGARHLRGLRFSEGTWKQLASDGSRCFLFYPSEKPSRAALRYIAEGEARGVHKAYKCRVRSPWWRVPLVEPPDVLFTYMNHDRPRLISNGADSYILNSLYGVKLKSSVKSLGSTLLPIACLNTVSLLGSELVGRAYGGGLLKHEPREADLLPVPSKELLSAARAELEGIAPQLSVALRQNDLLQAVEAVDDILLARHMHLSTDNLARLRDARQALFQRRVTRGKSSRGEN